jgi:hypothetical protein
MNEKQPACARRVVRGTGITSRGIGAASMLEAIDIWLPDADTAET